MYVNINREFLEKTLKEAAARAIKHYDDDGNTCLWTDNEIGEETVEEFSIEGNTLRVSVNNDLGYFSINIPLDLSDLLQILEYSAKSLNRFKTAIEALKSIQ